MAAAKPLRPSAGRPTGSERDTLRIAIEGQRAAEIRFQRNEEAVERVRAMVAAADRQLADATAAVTVARSVLVSQSYDSSAGGDLTSSSIRDALSRETDAREALLVARQNLETVQAGYQDASDETRKAADRVRRTAVSVMYTSADDLIERAEMALRTWRQARAGLSAITSFDSAYPLSSQFRRAALAFEVDESDLVIPEELQDPWLRAFESLQHDATAPLPEQSNE